MQVFIPGVTSDMMGLIVDYAYTRDADVSADNIERLLPAADQFHVLGLLKRCCDFLAAWIDVDNCIGIRNFARAYFCGSLERVANRSVCRSRDYNALAIGGGGGIKRYRSPSVGSVRMSE